MIDEKERLMLSYVLSQCKGNYKVIDIDDFEDFFKKRYPKRKFNFDEILSHLDALGYVDIKFKDDKKYCLCATKNAKNLFEEEKSSKKTTKKIKIEVILFVIFVFVFAFVGAFLGTFFYNLWV